jgi:hypothetical protein
VLGSKVERSPARASRFLRIEKVWRRGLCRVETDPKSGHHEGRRKQHRPRSQGESDRYRSIKYCVILSLTRWHAVEGKIEEDAWPMKFP